ncbi:NADPH:quinone reductase [Paenibacillus algorifonticola]|uniref:NADPH:quinone reductase n=1 Tax=Paenibacillus algorifonticola TaxID=684063 RepID=A0A1I2CSX8_9BACL|nr:zinc-binding dehydrogenase [Paenibacillus algorifonticola]SFE71344.1 NADPH:quinone reductase [Paenibacillus algorifonticola]
MFSWQAHSLGKAEEVVKKIEIPLPEPQENEARIKVLATVLGLPDKMMLEGTYLITKTLPISFGQEIVGIVDKAGSGYPFKEGDRVIGITGYHVGLGGLAEYCISPGDSAVLAPSTLSNEEAASFLGSFHVAYVGLVNRAAIKSGETLLVLGGAGRTGSAAIQLGKALGATVIATARAKEQEEFCRDQGADYIFNPAEQGFDETIARFTEGQGVNVIYDTVGGDVYTNAVNSITLGGRVVLIGFASGTWGRPDPLHILSKGYSVTGALHLVRSEEERTESIKVLNNMLETGKIQLPPTSVYGFDNAPEALSSLRERQLELVVVRGT